MILIKTGGTCFKRSIIYNNSNLYNSIYFMCKLCRTCTATPNCMVKVRASTFSSKHVESCDNKDNEEKFKIQIMKLCESADNKHVINLNALTSLIEDLENNNYNISETLGLLLLHWCGSMLHNESIKIRQELIDRTWNLLKAKNCKLTINYYHALLQAYINSNYIIDREQFLKNMCVPPEYDTYCLLLQVPSINDCAFVDNILSKVMQNTLPACSKIYDALKYAYAMNGNIEGIMKVINLIQETTKSSSARNDVYLMYALIKNGKFENVINTLKTIKLSASNTLKLVELISFLQDDLCIKKVLTYSQPLITEKEVISTIVKLVHAGCITNAYKVVTYIPIDTNCKSIRNILALCFLREMIKFNVDPECVIDIIHNLEEQNFISNIWEVSLQLALEESDKTLASRILNEMKATDVNINLNYFIDLLKYNNEDNLYSAIAKMINFNIIEDLDTFLNTVFSAVNIKDPIATIKKMKEHNILPICTVLPMVKFLINAGRLQESINTLIFFKKKIYCQDILDSLIDQYKKTNDIESIIQLVFELSCNGKSFVATLARNMISELQSDKNNIKHLIYLLDTAKKNDAAISLNNAQYIKKNILNMEIDEDLKNRIVQLISDISVKDINQNYNTEIFIHPEYMNVHQLYAHYRELESKNKNIRGVARRLFMVACKLNNIEIVKEIMEEFKNKELEWTPGMKFVLFDFYVKNRMIEEALHTLHETVYQFKHIKIDNFKILRFVILLVECNKVEVAYDTINNIKNINHKSNIWIQINELINSLLKNYPNEIPNMIDLLYENGYYNNKKQVLRRLFFTRLDDDDIEAALNILEMCVTKYKVVIEWKDILLKLAQLSSNSPSKYSEPMINKALINIKQVHGTKATNVFLVIAYALYKNKEKLQHLIETCDIQWSILKEELKCYKKEDILTIISSILEIDKTILKSCSVPIHNLMLSIHDCDKQGDAKGFRNEQEKIPSS